MLYELTITAPNQSGFFSKIMMAFRRRGRQPSAQKREVQGDTQIVTLTLEGADDWMNGLAHDIEAIGGTVVKLTPTQPAGGTIRVGRQIIETGPRPGSSDSAGTPAKPTTTIRVGRQVLQIAEAPIAPPSSGTTKIAIEPTATLRVGRQILDVGARPASLISTRTGRESSKPSEYAGGPFTMTGVAT